MRNYSERASYSWTEDSIRYINTPGMTARSIYFYVQEAGYFKTFPPYFTERENLDSFLIVYTVSGSGLLQYGGSEYHVRPGQCFFINCTEHHYYAVPKNGTWEFVWLHFNAANALGYYQEYVKNGFHISTPADGTAVEVLLRQILELCRQTFAGAEAQISNKISNVLTELLMTEAGSPSDPSFLPEPVKRAMKFIDRHYQEDISLEQIAQAASFSRCHISREFHRYTDMTIQEYLIANRIAYAKMQLKYTDKSVGEIAAAAGMCSASHFIGIFRARAGMTPLAFRRAWKDTL